MCCVVLAGSRQCRSKLHEKAVMNCEHSSVYSCFNDASLAQYTPINSRIITEFGTGKFVQGDFIVQFTYYHRIILEWLKKTTKNLCVASAVAGPVACDVSLLP